ncbi:ccr4 associated factor [Coemansia sp. RSA 2322]|nr:ccr4 associated factor [Coemansia sp. RSA 2322]
MLATAGKRAARVAARRVCGQLRGLSTGPASDPSAAPLAALDAQASYAPVAGRAVISVAGADAEAFLQGMQCNDMARAAEGGMFTGFLTPQGRMLADAFVYAAGDGGFLVEVDARVSERVMRTLQFYRLRSRVAIRDASLEYAAWAAWGPGGEDVAWAAAGADAGLADRRAPGMGVRLLVAGGRAPSLPAAFGERADADARLRRILRGVGEGADDFVPGVAVPLECNVDLMGGVHFSKGCYVGQELTIRTHHRGAVRKRLVPLLLAHSAPLPPMADVECLRPDDPPRRKRAPGRLGSVAGNAALALLRLEDVALFSAARASFAAVATDGSRMAKSKVAAAAASLETPEDALQKYQCSDLKRQLEELEEYNELLAIKLFRSQKRLRRMKIERNILLDRFEHSRHVSSSRTHNNASNHIDDSGSDSDAPLKNTFPRPPLTASDSEPIDRLQPSVSPIPATASVAAAVPTAHARWKASHNNLPSSSASTPMLISADSAVAAAANSPSALTSYNTGTFRKPRSEKDPNAPRRPANAFVLYCQDVRPNIKSNYVDMNSGELTRAMAVTWKALEKAEKQKYFDLYEREMYRYHKELIEYNSSLSTKTPADVPSVPVSAASAAAASAAVTSSSATSESSTAIVPPFADTSSRDGDMDVDHHHVSATDDDEDEDQTAAAAIALLASNPTHAAAATTACIRDLSISAEPPCLPTNGTHSLMSRSSASPTAASAAAAAISPSASASPHASSSPRKNPTAPQSTAAARRDMPSVSPTKQAGQP